MASAGKNIRAFLAIEPPEEILQAVIRLQEKLKWEISGKLSWTRPGGQHLTLKFFGDVSAEEVDSIGQSVRNCLQPGWALNLKIEKLGAFPNAHKPRVLWCGTSGDVEKLAALQKQLEADFAGIGFPEEDRPFRAHLTLARIRDPRGLPGMGEVLQKYHAVSAGEFIVKELVLFQSRLTPQGAIYTRLAAFPLAG